MDMEVFNGLIFNPECGEFCVEPSASFEEMEDLILNDDDSKEIISFGHMEPMSKFDNLKDCIMQDGESIEEKEKIVQ